MFLNDWEQAKDLALKALEVMLPGEDVVGDPYWVLMEIQNGQVTGNYWTRKHSGKMLLPLFISRELADRSLSILPDREDFVVRGVSRSHLDVLKRLISYYQGTLLEVTEYVGGLFGGRPIT